MADDEAVWPPAPVDEVAQKTPRREEVGLGGRRPLGQTLELLGGLFIGFVGYPLFFWGLGRMTLPLFNNLGTDGWWAAPMTLALIGVGALCLRLRRQTPLMALGIFFPSVLWSGLWVFLIVAFRGFEMS